MTTTEVLFIEKQPVCPFCGSAITNEHLSETGQSQFATYECGLELANQSAYTPRAWRRPLDRHCKNVYRIVLELQRSVP